MYGNTDNTLQDPPSLWAFLKELFIGPLRFILCMNDFKFYTKLMNFIHFADDITIYTTDKTISSQATKTNTEVHTVGKWLQINRIFVKVRKHLIGQFLTFFSKPLPAPVINRSDLVHNHTTNFLDILNDNKFKLFPHIRDVV